MKHVLPLVAALLLGTALLAGTPAHAQQPPDPIDAIFAWAMPSTPGCAVAVKHHGQLVVNRAYGLADLERDVPISLDTVFDIGSVVKQFVAASVLLLVEDGRLALSDDIRTHLPELPDTGHVVTVDHLLTHTSGIRDWTGILPLAATPTDAFTLALRQRGLNFAPGDEWSYSNSGYVLLKHLVARISGMSFGEFTRQRLFEPLGMTQSSYQHDLREVVKNRALAYEQQDGRWRLDILLDEARGGDGGLLSTTGDLLIWNDALSSGHFGPFVTEQLQEPARLNNGRTLGYARGLYLDSNRGGRVIWHSGSANAYNSLLARFPEQELSVAILCNAGDIAENTVFARRIFDVFVPTTEPAPTPNGGSPTSGAPAPDLTGRAGLYFSDRTGEPLRLTVERGTLRVAGGPPLIPVAEDRVRPASPILSFMSGDAFALHFQSPDEFVLTSMEGQTTTYRRALPYAPTPADLEAFAGRYHSDEIGAMFEVAPGDGAVILRLGHAPTTAVPFRPIAPDTFQVSMVTVRFLRDGSGNVVALSYSNPLLRDIRFTRLPNDSSPS